MNISVGMLPSAGEREQQELLSAVDDLWDRGIMVVAAAGNNGPKDEFGDHSRNLKKDCNDRKQ